MLRALVRHGSGVVGVALLGLLVLTALFAPVIARDVPEQTNFLERFQAPSIRHPLGTDHLGRDVFDRIVWGARLSILSGIGALLVGSLIGMAVGLTGGYLGGLVDRLLMRVIDVLLAFPTLLLALIVVAILGPGRSRPCWRSASRWWRRSRA
jgi:ABC-type dipeptide/oligopeptide/nickel transport system permease subunit